MRTTTRIRESLRRMREMPTRLDELQKAVGRVESRLCELQNANAIHQNEFKVYSQWGEDGIIQFLLRHVPVEHRVFVEFGVTDYTEANTRFLLQNNNWAGLVLDSSEANIEHIRRDPIYWRYNLKAECAFIDRDNINDILQKSGVSGDIGLLSIDIDGNDYWVWEAIDSITPRIVICEYRSLFGWKRKVTIPYSQDFDRAKAHSSMLYYGASIAALDHLARAKGYALVGSNSAGCNVFFVRRDILNDLPTYTPAEAYVQAQFREARGSMGQLSFADFQESLELIADMPLVDLDTGDIIKAGELRNG